MTAYRAIDGRVQRVDGPYLTDAEAAVLHCLADGLSYDQAAVRLGKTADTVKMQMQQARTRWAARNTAHLVTLTVRAGALALFP